MNGAKNTLRKFGNKIPCQINLVYKAHFQQIVSIFGMKYLLQYAFHVVVGLKSGSQRLGGNEKSIFARRSALLVSSEIFASRALLENFRSPVCMCACHFALRRDCEHHTYKWLNGGAHKSQHPDAPRKRVKTRKTLGYSNLFHLICLNFSPAAERLML